jgi:hypothetical protein
MIPLELLADQLATMTFLMELMALIGALPAATQATAGSLPNNQHYCKKRQREREREREKEKESRD